MKKYLFLSLVFISIVLGVVFIVNIEKHSEDSKVDSFVIKTNETFDRTLDKSAVLQNDLELNSEEAEMSQDSRNSIHSNSLDADIEKHNQEFLKLAKEYDNDLGNDELRDKLSAKLKSNEEYRTAIVKKFYEQRDKSNQKITNSPE